MTPLAEKVVQDLLHAIDTDRVVLPTLPEVALKVREAAEDPNVGVAELSRVIALDAALTARLIKVVNSPLLRTSKEITDLQMAVGRLGINYTANLATGLAMQQMFQATSDAVDRKMREVWSQGTEIAATSHALCKKYTRLMADRALLAGLVHQIGVLPILTYAEEQEDLLANAITLDQVTARIHPQIGERILKVWDFPADIACVPREYLVLDRQPAAADYADIVQVASQLHAQRQGQQDIAVQTLPAGIRLGLNNQPDPAQDQSFWDAVEQSRTLLG
ncbi:HDOD domain-containing protein [Pseudomonas sp. PS02302]|uniref:HDOD domain-containing protein n=1 Tax=Pseudomonas sp. PS02302 TaxID=2991428 RepID=UPI00249ACF44|nr:HDOD domain-containing protein [Pseudomonas sp. PS02302]